MIRISKDRVLEDFFIDDNGIITDKEGNVQKVSYYGGKRPRFKQVYVHRIQMWTKYGWRDTKIWDIHHIDGDKSNNSILNLIFLTHSDHTILHNKGNNYMRGKKMPKKSVESISKATKLRNLGRRWFNDGVRNYFIHPEDCPPNYIKGMLTNVNNNNISKI